MNGSASATNSDILHGAGKFTSLQFYNTSSKKAEDVFSAAAWRPIVTFDGANMTDLYYESIQIKSEKLRVETDSTANATSNNTSKPQMVD